MGANNNFKIYGEPVLQKIEEELRIRGKNPALRAVDNYTLKVAKNDAYGYMVAAAYLKPEIGLKAAITYRSDIDHDVNYAESIPIINALPPALAQSLGVRAT